MSQPVRRTFDISKAEAMRARAGNPSYADLARGMGLKSRQAVGHWFRERGEPSVQQMKEMASVLGCHWLELVTDDAFVVYRQEEIDHFERWRKLSDEDRQELNRFIEFKLAKNGDEDG